jgi:hypothetical protein
MKQSPMICHWLALFAYLLGALTTHAETFDRSIEPRQEDAFAAAHYRLWMPRETPELRGLLIRQHGCGSGAREKGLDHAQDPQWQALAQKHGFALMGSQLWAPEEDCSTWTMPEDGSAHALERALEHFAEITGHPEMTTIPWCLWGHSGGAIWTMNMVYLYPERILAAFPRSGGLSPAGRTYARSQPQPIRGNPAAFKVPILFCYGAKEREPGNRFNALIEGIHQVFEAGREEGAPWALAVHPEAEHENAQSRQLALRFFDTLIPKRLPDPLSASTNLLELKRENAWLGKQADLQIAPLSPDTAPSPNSSYLAEESLAESWKAFATQGNIPDTTPPPPPHELRVHKAGSQTELSWNAWADIESGIGHFAIYRKGKLLGHVGGPEHPATDPQGFFHTWNYHDQPLLGDPLARMQFIDKTAPETIQPEDYEVRTVNQAGLDSAPTQGLSSMGWDSRQNTSWKSLSGENALGHWQGSPKGGHPKGWLEKDGKLEMDPNASGGSSSLFSTEIYGDFELTFQYRIGKGGNSGVKYRMTHYDGQFLGPEYQILDDEAHYPGYRPGTDTTPHYITATLYVLEMGDWSMDPRHPPGIWNQGRIVVQGPRIEHWLNGVCLVETRHDTLAFKEAIASSKFKRWPHYGQNAKGRIMLQDHGTGVAFKEVQIRSLDTTPSPSPSN